MYGFKTLIQEKKNKHIFKGYRIKMGLDTCSVKGV